MNIFSGVNKVRFFRFVNKHLKKIIQNYFLFYLLLVIYLDD